MHSVGGQVERECAWAARKDNCTLGCITHSTANKLREGIVPLRSAQPQLKHCSYWLLAWSEEPPPLLPSSASSASPTNSLFSQAALLNAKLPAIVGIAPPSRSMLKSCCSRGLSDVSCIQDLISPQHYTVSSQSTGSSSICKQPVPSDPNV